MEEMATRILAQLIVAAVGIVSIMVGIYMLVAGGKVAWEYIIDSDRTGRGILAQVGVMILGVLIIVGSAIAITNVEGIVSNLML